MVYNFGIIKTIGIRVLRKGQVGTLNLSNITKVKQRIKKWCTIDHIVDLSVDIFLLIWDVISSPILIVMRVIRHFVGEWFTDKIKAGVRWIAHWFERKRAQRLKYGHGLFRTYWFLILPSPFILIALILALAIFAGLTEGLDIAMEEWDDL